MPELHDPHDVPDVPHLPDSHVPEGPDGPEGPEDVLASALKDAAAVGQTAAVPAPVALIMARGDRVRRRRTVGYAVAACLAVGGTGIAAAAVLPFGGGPVAPATSPSVSPPDREAPTPQRSEPGPTASGSGPPRSGTPTGIGTSATGHGTATSAPGGPVAATTTSAPPRGSTLGRGAPTTMRTTQPPG